LLFPNLEVDIADDGTVLVGRDYDGLPGSSIGSTGSGLVAAGNYDQQTMVDFADMVEPAVYQAPMGDMSRTAGVVVDDVWLRPTRHRIDPVSLECRPPEASFRRAGGRGGGRVIGRADTQGFQMG